MCQEDTEGLFRILTSASCNQSCQIHMPIWWSSTDTFLHDVIDPIMASSLKRAGGNNSSFRKQGTLPQCGLSRNEAMTRLMAQPFSIRLIAYGMDTSCCSDALLPGSGVQREEMHGHGRVCCIGEQTIASGRQSNMQGAKAACNAYTATRNSRRHSSCIRTAVAHPPFQRRLLYCKMHCAAP